MTRIRLVAWFALFSLIFVPAAWGQSVCEGVAPVQETGLKTVPVVEGLSGRPLLVTAPPNDPDRIFVVEQDGAIWVHQRGAATTDVQLFLDLTATVSTLGNEMGLLGMAFDPDFDGDPVNGNGDFYVNYTENVGIFDVYTVVARYTVSAADPNVADPASEVRILRLSQPQTNHNAGYLEFGADGFLYVNTGDGGGGGDPHGTCGNGQNTGNLLGKIVRIDVRDVDPAGLAPDCEGTVANYTVPSDNPFADGAGGDCDEIFDYGLRNPWRSSFDRGTGDLYIADVGQDCWEEVNWVAEADLGGNNFGWRVKEGAQCFDPADTTNCDPPGVNCAGSPSCDDPSLVDPVVQISQSDPGSPCSVTGGYVYRGCLMTGIQGDYFYGDYCDGFVRTFEILDGVAGDFQDRTAELDPAGSLAFGLTSFGLDARGEIFIVDRSGTVLKILPLFGDLEVAGTGTAPAEQFLLNRGGDWTWQDLELATEHPVDFYRVYRGVPNGTFTCIHSTVDAGWPTGDATDPNAGELLAYLVTAVSPAGEESSSGDPERTLSNPCSAP